jgi:hypothetical protein
MIDQIAAASAATLLRPRLDQARRVTKTQNGGSATLALGVVMHRAYLLLFLLGCGELEYGRNVRYPG